MLLIGPFGILSYIQMNLKMSSEDDGHFCSASVLNQAEDKWNCSPKWNPSYTNFLSLLSCSVVSKNTWLKLVVQLLQKGYNHIFCCCQSLKVILCQICSAAIFLVKSNFRDYKWFSFYPRPPSTLKGIIVLSCIWPSYQPANCTSVLRPWWFIPNDGPAL